MKRNRIALLTVVLLMVAGGVAYRRLTSAPPTTATNVADPQPPATATGAESPEEKTRLQLIGTFQDEYKGKRTMTLNPDGTGTMRVVLTGAQAFLFASELRFDMKWSLRDNVLTKTTVSGEPSGRAGGRVAGTDRGLPPLPPATASRGGSTAGGGSPGHSALSARHPPHGPRIDRTECYHPRQSECRARAAVRPGNASVTRN